MPLATLPALLPYSGAAPMEEMLYEPFYPIMRLRLLADRMVEHKEFGVSEAKVVVSAPEGNRAYREKITSPPLARLVSRAENG